MGMPITLSKTDIVPLVIRAWALSFGRIQPNKIAIARRGWGPLNRALLTNKEILKTKISAINVDEDQPSFQLPSTSENLLVLDMGSLVSSDLTGTTASAEKLANTLNLSIGISGSIVTDALQYAMKECSVHSNMDRRYTDGKTLQKQMEGSHKRMTAGKIFRSGKTGLDKEVLVLQEEKEEALIRNRNSAIDKATAEFAKRMAAATAVIVLNKPVKTLKILELKAVVHFKKRKGDKAIPSTKPELLIRYKYMIHHSNQTIADYLVDSGHSVSI